MSGPTGEAARSVECVLAERPGYGDVHGLCRQIRDVPLPHSTGILLVQRCGCACHASGAE